MNLFRDVCRLEWNLRSRFSNQSLSTNGSTCQWIGPGKSETGRKRSEEHLDMRKRESIQTSMATMSVFLLVSLLFDGQCEDLTADEWEDSREQWSKCNSSKECSNRPLQHYLTFLNSSSVWKIYLSADDDPQRRKTIIELYSYLQHSPAMKKFQLLDWKFDSTDEEILFFHLLRSNLPYLGLSFALYFLCMFLFVKNLFFAFILLLHISLSLSSTSLIYLHFFHFPLTLLNSISVTLFLFVVLVDAFLWYTCWFVNDHRRDDCTIHRTIENLLTQIFYYLVPKNLTSIIALVLTYTNQIIALQCFTVFSVFLLLISFLVSFTLYPGERERSLRGGWQFFLDLVSFIFLLRYQSSLVTLQRCFPRLLFTSCFLERTLPYLIVRLKAFWLTLFTVFTCLGLVILFHWPQLHYDVCRITFDALPKPRSSARRVSMPQSIDLDLTYYIGSLWEVPSDPLIPSRDIPVLDYNAENKMSSQPGSVQRFADVLEQNLTQLIDFCSQLASLHRTQTVEHRHITNESSLEWGEPGPRSVFLFTLQLF